MIIRPLKLLLTGVIFLLPTSAAAITGALLQSEPGEYFLNGETREYAPEYNVLGQSTGAEFNVTVVRNHFEFSIRNADVDWTIDLGSYIDESGTRMPLDTRTYSDARDSSYFRDVLHPHLTIAKENVICSGAAVYGWYKVLQLEIAADGQVEKLAVDLVSRCKGAGTPRLYAALRLNSDVPLRTGLPYAVAGRDQHATEGDSVQLSGSQSYSRSGSLAQYQWVQRSGTLVALNNANGATPNFTAPAISAGKETLQFELTVTDNAGKTSTDQVAVTVHDTLAERTRVLVRATKGRSGLRTTLEMDEEDTYVRLETMNFSGALPVSIRGSRYSRLLFDTPGTQPPEVGRHVGARRYPFQSPLRPGFELIFLDPPCFGDIHWWFQIHEMEFDAGGTPDRFAADVFGFCPADFANPSEFGVYAEIRKNSNVPVNRAYPVANPGRRQVAQEGDTIFLDAGESFSPFSSVALYNWLQTGGRDANLESPAEISTAVIAPQVEPGGEALTFDLSVTDQNGASDTDQVSVYVYDSADPRSVAYFDIEPFALANVYGIFEFDEANSIISQFDSEDRFLDLRVVGDENWSLRIASPDNPRPQAGFYDNAESFFERPEPGKSALEASGSHRACNRGGGWFEIHEIEYNDEGNVISAAIDFLQHCENNPAGYFGAYRLHSAIPTNVHLPVAEAGADQEATGGNIVTLDGSASRHVVDGPLTYHWFQYAGESVALSDRNAATPAFTMPDGSSNAPLGFIIAVVDQRGRRNFDHVVIRYSSSTDTETPAPPPPTPETDPVSGDGAQNDSATSNSSESSGSSGGGSSGGGAVSPLDILFLFALVFSAWLRRQQIRP